MEELLPWVIDHRDWYSAVWPKGPAINHVDGVYRPGLLQRRLLRR